MSSKQWMDSLCRVKLDWPVSSKQWMNSVCRVRLD